MDRESLLENINRLEHDKDKANNCVLKMIYVDAIKELRKELEKCIS